MIQHRSVMLEEVIENLDVHSQCDYIDCTLGGGGYTREILERNGPNGKVLAIDTDEETIRRTGDALAQFGSRLIKCCGNFRNVASFAKEHSFNDVWGIVYDLGLSSDLLSSSGRGFSFLLDEPLDMRFSLEQHITASQLINSLREEEIANIIWTFGEERYSRCIAKVIVQARKKKRITSTFELRDCIASAVPASYRRGRIHCATRTFQALRMAVNEELQVLEESLAQAISVLRPGGRIVVVSFHSLEDRIVKNTFKQFQKEKQAIILTKKPIQATQTEIRLNPRSRSAKLRCIQKEY